MWLVCSHTLGAPSNLLHGPVHGLVLAVHSAIEGAASNTETVTKYAFHHVRLIHLLISFRRTSFGHARPNDF
jgi:hypothetical protein